MFVSSPYWRKAKLTKSGRPELIDQENDILIQDNIGLYQDNYKLVKFQKGKLYLTNKRIIFVDNHHESRNNLELNLIDIDTIDMYNGFWKSSPKISLKMRKKKLRSASSTSANNSSNTASEVNWICPICSFSNAIKTNSRIKTDADVPACRNCGMKPVRYLIEGVIQASARELTPVNNVVSSEGFQCPTCTFINDVSLKNCEMCGTRLVSSNLPPQLLHDDTEKPLQLEVEGDPDKSTTDLTNPVGIRPEIIKLSFRKGGVKTFWDRLEAAKDQAIWEHMKANSKVNLESVQVHKTGSSSASEPQKDGPKFGIQGLQNKREMESFEKSLLLNNSLQDLENLMEKAKELIALSNSYQKVLAKDRSNSSKINDTANILANSKSSIHILNNIITKNEFVNNSADSSMMSTLRQKGTDSDLYLEELSRQLFEFLVDSDIITKNHGLITLFDLFIVYNRARGINLISPEELFHGVQLFEKLKFKYVMLQIPLISKNITDIIQHNENSTKKSSDYTKRDKIHIISHKNFSFNSILQKIVKHIDREQDSDNIYYGLSIFEIQSNPHIKLNINYLILNQILLENCMSGILCVDQELQGNFYYKNEILSFDWNEYINGNDRQIEVKEKQIEFDINSWVNQNLPDQLDVEGDEDNEEGADENGEYRVMSPSSISEYDFNYRLGSKPVTKMEEDEIHDTDYRKLNGALKDLEGLQF